MMTRSRSGFDEAANKCELTSIPRPSKALLCGISIVVRGVYFKVSARPVENTEARNVDR